MENLDNRTTAIGLFNYAETYRRAGINLIKSENGWTHRHAPEAYLLSHSIELFLKSFLRQHRSIADLKKLGHNISKLYKNAQKDGLNKLPVTSHLVDNFDMSYFLEVRYIKTGFKVVPENRLLSYVSAELCKEIHSSFLTEYKNLGLHLKIENIFDNETFDASLIN